MIYTKQEDFKNAVAGFELPVLVMPDMHLKKQTWSNWFKLFGDPYKVLERFSRLIYDLKKDNISVDTCIMPGDIFDHSMAPAADLLELSTFMANFSQTMFIQGNHDIGKTHYMDSLGAIHLLPDEPFMLKSPKTGQEYPIYGLDYQNNMEELNRALKAVSESVNDVDENCSSVLVLHQAFRHLLDLDGLWQLEKEVVHELLPCTFVISGHIHQLDSTDYFLSPGATYPNNAGAIETPNYMTILDIASRTVASFPVKVREYACIDSSDTLLQDIQRCIDSAEPEIKAGNMLPIAITIKRDVSDRVAPKDGIRGLDSAIIRYAINEQSDTNPDIGRQSFSDVTLADAIKQDLQQNYPNNYQALQQLAEIFLNSTDIQETARELFNNWKVTTK